MNVEGNDWVFYLGEEPGQLGNLLARLLADPTKVSPQPAANVTRGG